MKSLRETESLQVGSRFPILAQEVYGKRLVYLDSAATSQKPDTVIDAVSRYYRESNANVRRGVHALSYRSTQSYEATRIRVAGFIGAASADEIVFTRGTTESINLVAATLGADHLREGDEILLTTLEHHANIVPWQLIAKRTGAKVVAAPLTSTGDVDLNFFSGLVNERTRIVAIAHISNALGTVNPVKKMTQIAKRAGAFVLVDGAQGIHHRKVDVQEIGCDFYAFSGHKMYGPTGIGVLYGKMSVLETMSPYQGGGDMIASVSFEKTHFAAPPQRFEAGTPNIAGVIGLNAAIDFIEEIGIDRITLHEGMLMLAAEEMLRNAPGVAIVGSPRERAGAISFTVRNAHPHDVGTVLDREGIAVRAGHHCAQPLMRALDIPATVRASFGVYNTLDDISALGTALEKVEELFG
ncbi:MAG: cysteine desulfurase [Armatimonadota bacterium]|nr:cysteine desulfurase [Armatimonadota bacterium]